MIHERELRPGNYILQKKDNKIGPIACTSRHFELFSQGSSASLYPIVLKADILEQCGFKENKDYPLLPGAREFTLVLPVHGSSKNEIKAYIKNNGECFGRATVNDLPASVNFFHLHRLQNLYFALTGEELPMRNKLL
jgi:hypothetical protein